jgi:hypothetical protein
MQQALTTKRRTARPWMDCDLVPPELVERRRANTMSKPTPEQKRRDDEQARMLAAALKKD